MQRKLAKNNAFELLNESTAFWLEDYCQKILPAKYREGQKEHFGKKRHDITCRRLFSKGKWPVEEKGLLHSCVQV